MDVWTGGLKMAWNSNHYKLDFEVIVNFYVYLSSCFQQPFNPMVNIMLKNWQFKWQLIRLTLSHDHNLFRLLQNLHLPQTFVSLETLGLLYWLFKLF